MLTFNLPKQSRRSLLTRIWQCKEVPPFKRGWWLLKVMLGFTATVNYSLFRIEVARGAQPVLLRFLSEVRTEIRKRMDAPKSGRRGPSRRRSARGEAPARQSGRLYRDMQLIDVPLRPHLDVNAPYAIFLEPPALLDRPFAQIAVDDVRQRFQPIGL